MKILVFIFSVGLVSSAQAAKISVEDALKAVFAKVGALETGLEAPLGKTSDGKVCEVYIDARPGQPYYSMQVDLPVIEGDHKVELASSHVTLYPPADNSGNGYSIRSVKDSATAIEVKMSEHTPRGHTDFGWPTPAHTENIAFTLRFNGNGDLVSATAVENEGTWGFGKTKLDCVLDKPLPIHK